MALDDDIRILSAVDLLSALSAEQLRLLAFGAETIRFAAGREIYREGAAADCAFVVARGTVVLTGERDGGPQELARFGPGTLLGGLALIAETSRPTGAVAQTDVEAIRLNRTLFRRILEEYPDVAAELHERLARDLQSLVAKLEKAGSRLSF